MASLTKYKLFASITPRFEDLLAQEFNQILKRYTKPHFPITDSKELEKTKERKISIDKGSGGIELLVSQDELWMVANSTRFAESLRIRLGSTFPTRNWKELAEGISKLAWKAYLPFTSPADKKVIFPRISVVCHRSALYHDNAVKSRIQEYLREKVYSQSDVNVINEDVDDEESVVPAIHIRILRDYLQVSIDASGELLYRRTEGKHVTKAPIRETIAAALLQMSYNNVRSPNPYLRPVWDPFCGSGTFILEALGTLSSRAGESAESLIISKDRKFAFEYWRTHPTERYQNLLSNLSKSVSGDVTSVTSQYPSVMLLGSDIDEKAVSASKHNLTTFNRRNINSIQSLPLKTEVRFVKGDFDEVEPTISTNVNPIIISNLPYGYRLEEDNLRNTFYRFGKMLDRRKDIKDVFVLNGNQYFVHSTGLEWEKLESFSNRGLSVDFLKLKR